MLIFFIVTSLFFAVFVGIWFGLMFTTELEGICKIIVTTIIALVIGCIISLIYCRQEKEWNNGYCKECGEKWELFDVERGTYYYKDSNGHITWF